MHRLVLAAIQVENSPQALALGAASVAAAVARSRGGSVEVELVEDLPAATKKPIAQASADLVERVMAWRPDWLGLSVYSWNRAAMLELARRCRELDPRLVIFAGGPEATADPAGLLSAGAIDLALRGEGESLTLRVLDALVSHPAGKGEARLTAPALYALSAMAGIALPGVALPGIALPGVALPGVALPGEAPSALAPLEDLASLPSPWLERTIAPRSGGVLWELARGCPYRCAYCYEGKGERGTRRIPKARMEAELDEFLRLGVGQVFVLDPTFDADRAGAKEILDLLAGKAPGIHWKFEIRAELVDRQLAAKFAAIPSSLQVGLQSADPAVSAACGRPLDLKAFSRGIGFLNGAGAVFGIDLIYGLPLDSLEGFCRSLDYALGFQPNHLDVFPLSLLPGTELAGRAAEFGLVAEPSAPYQVLSSPGFPAEAMAEAARISKACDYFYSRGRAVSWFLQILKPLRQRPSTFLTHFAESLPPAAPSGSREIEAVQLDFIERQYKAKGLFALLPAARDIIRFNAAWGRALAEGEESDFDLVYDPEDVLGPSALSLADFAGRAVMRLGRWRVVPSRSGPKLRRSGTGSGTGPWQGR